LFDKLQTLKSNLSVAINKIKSFEQPKQTGFGILDCYFKPNGEFASKYTLPKIIKAQ